MIGFLYWFVTLLHLLAVETIGGHSPVVWNLESQLKSVAIPMASGPDKDKIVQRLKIIEKEATTRTNATLFPVLIGDHSSHWNPTIVALPAFFSEEYLVVSRVVTEGLHHKNTICTASWSSEHGGIRCTGNPAVLDLPSSSSRHCMNPHIREFVNFPGLHDLRLVWSHEGELMLVGGSQSSYGCFGLFAISISFKTNSEIYSLLRAHSPFNIGPPASFFQLTELNRPTGRNEMEKNWAPFFSPIDGMFIQQDLNPNSRSVSKHLGDGFMSSNLVTNAEKCFPVLKRTTGGIWHQATNALRVILCYRDDESCKQKHRDDGIYSEAVYFSLLHLKITNKLGLMDGGRYERYIAVWEDTNPFRLLAISAAPILLADEKDIGGFWGNLSSASNRTHGYLKKEHYLQDNLEKSFAYVMSLAWDVKRSSASEHNTGFLDEKVILSLGIGDKGAYAAKVGVKELLQNLNFCKRKGGIDSI